MFSFFLYFSILLIASSSAYIAQYGNNFSLRISARFICFFSMFIPAALRTTGTDLGNYMLIYEKQFPDNLQQMEIGFKYLGIFCYKLNFPAHLFIVTVAAITYWILCFNIPRRFIFLIIIFYNLMFCYLDSYNLIRQYLAISFLLYGIILYFNKKELRGLISILFATSIHISSAVGLLIILFSNIRMNNYFRIIVVLLLIIALPVFLPEIIGLFAFFLPRVSGILTTVLIRPSFNTGLSMLIYATIPLLVMLSNKDIIREYNIKKGNFIVNCNFFYLNIVAFGTFGMNFFRLHAALVSIPLFSIPILLNCNKKYRDIIFFPFLFFCIMFFLRWINRPGADLLYVSVFR